MISREFGQSQTFTIVDAQDGFVTNVEVIQNPSGSIDHCRRPVVAKHLSDLGVKKAMSGEFGPGASMMLKELRIEATVVAPGQRVLDALKDKGLITV